MTIQEQINKIKTEALEAFNKNNPVAARKYIRQLKELDKKLYNEESYDLSKSDPD